MRVEINLPPRKTRDEMDALSDEEFAEYEDQVLLAVEQGVGVRTPITSARLVVVALAVAFAGAAFIALSSVLRMMPGIFQLFGAIAVCFVAGSYGFKAWGTVGRATRTSVRQALFYWPLVFDLLVLLWLLKRH